MLSTLGHNGDALGASRGRQPQQNCQTYSELFNEPLMTGHSAQQYQPDFDLSRVTTNVVDLLKNKSNSSEMSSNRPSTNIKHPCGVCKKSVSKNQKAIFCSTCLNWIHRKCNGMSVKEYEDLVNKDENLPWQCISCNIEDIASKFPLGYLSNMKVNYLYGLDFPSQLKLLPTYELQSTKLSHIPTLADFDMEQNYVQSMNSKYFDIPDFSQHDITSTDKHFSIFHVSTRSLSKNFDQLQSVLSGLGLVFDLIGITETHNRSRKISLQMLISLTIIYIVNPLKEQWEELQFMLIINSITSEERTLILNLSRYGLKPEIPRAKTFYVAVSIDIPTVTFLTL